jgi:hypothetical protein
MVLVEKTQRDGVVSTRIRTPLPHEHDQSKDKICHYFRRRICRVADV